MLQSFILLSLSVVKCASQGNSDATVLLRGFVCALGFVCMWASSHVCKGYIFPASICTKSFFACSHL